jgi:hypothetical protein
MQRKRNTVLPTFEDEDRIRAIVRLDPANTRIYCRDDRQIIYIENLVERFISAQRWGVPVPTLIDFMDRNGDDLSYTGPAGFAYSLYRKRFAPAETFIMTAGDFRSVISRSALYGGRCEVYSYHTGPAHQYDINSAYPSSALALQFPAPRSIHYARPPSIENIHRYEGVSRVVFSQDGFVPVLPVRYAMRVVYPHADHVTGDYTHTELRYALVHGVTIHSVEKQYIAEFHKENPAERD